MNNLVQLIRNSMNTTEIVIYERRPANWLIEGSKNDLNQYMQSNIAVDILLSYLNNKEIQI